MMIFAMYYNLHTKKDIFLFDSFGFTELQRKMLLIRKMVQVVLLNTTTTDVFSSFLSSKKQKRKNKDGVTCIIEYY